MADNPKNHSTVPVLKQQILLIQPCNPMRKGQEKGLNRERTAYAALFFDVRFYHSLGKYFAVIVAIIAKSIDIKRSSGSSI